ncbi:GntR family transcriptional regulator [Dethiosulfatarculus sandiegensis]|uniref:GntR family transcriptional regulator n=1 Tax=Dethiosulfatarculus sandiegensis TaxID=1429043 RepID=A0A0D2K040_9BACT|nr:GntR family transcriptional regulator [Dethiosulfatarculus sandiegensis]KIX15105.1 GntR family transcriptional regulator [Dethiosulfatarculus sandiegensis]
MVVKRQPKRLGEYAYQEIKELILKNKLVPGQNLSIGYLAETLNLSQTPIREALGRLNAEGLIVHTAHKKIRVSEITDEDLLQTYQARKLLEPQLVEILTQSLSKGSTFLRAAQKLHKNINKVLESDMSEVNIDLYLQIDKQLNDLIMLPVRGTLTGDLQLTINERSLRFRNYAETFATEDTQKENMIRVISREHLNIVQAIIAQDSNMAKAYTLIHLENSKQRTFASLKHANNFPLESGATHKVAGIGS